MNASHHHPTFTRRKFVGFGLAAVAAGRVSTRAASPNGKLNIGIIGSGGRGGANLGGVKSENIYSLCDVNRNTLESVKAKFGGAKSTTDWREIVTDPSIDAVVISTADHHHALAAIAAMRQKKNTSIVEKPLAHTVQRSSLRCKTNSQETPRQNRHANGHANSRHRQLPPQSWNSCRAGAIGSRSPKPTCGAEPNDQRRSVKPNVARRASRFPTGFNWDVWLGPAA